MLEFITRIFSRKKTLEEELNEEWDDTLLSSGITPRRYTEPKHMDKRTHSACDLNTLFRYDYRSPIEIMNTGFQGTISKNHLFEKYNKKTVFSAACIEGADIFRNAPFNKQKRKEKPRNMFLYKIAPSELNTYDFRRQYILYGEKSMINLHMALARNRPELYKRNLEGISKKLPHSQLNGEYYKRLRGRLDVFLNVNEVHIEGPVAPQHISPFMRYTHPSLEYLDLAINSLPVGRENNNAFKESDGYDPRKKIIYHI